MFLTRMKASEALYEELLLRVYLDLLGDAKILLSGKNFYFGFLYGDLTII